MSAVPRPDPAQPVLEVEGLGVDIATPRGPLRAVRDVSFQVKRGETLCIVGESGCGKSITSLAVMSLLPAAAKRRATKLSLLGEDLLKASPGRVNALRGNRMAMIFQEPMTALNPAYTIGNQLMESYLLHRGGGPTKARERAIELLGKVAQELRVARGEAPGVHLGEPAEGGLPVNPRQRPSGLEHHLHGVVEADECTGPCAGQSGLAEITQDFQRFIDLRIQGPDKRLTIVSGVALKKGRHFDWDAVTCQLPMGKYFGRRYMAIRHQDQVPALRQFDRCEALADTLGPGCVRAHEYGHVGPELRAQRLQLGRMAVNEFPDHLADGLAVYLNFGG